MLLGRPTPCAGRERVLRVMDRLFDECAGERTAQAMLVTGPAGIRKSRLRDEFIAGRQKAPLVKCGWGGAMP
jgi:predicted ATPase